MVRQPTETSIIFHRVVFDIISSPFLLNLTIKYHLKRYSNYAKIFLEKFSNEIYVDDSTFGFVKAKEPYDFQLNAKQIMKEGGFELCKDVEVMNENKQDENINCSPTLNESNHTRQVLDITGDLNPGTLTFLF